MDTDLQERFAHKKATFFLLCKEKVTSMTTSTEAIKDNGKLRNNDKSKLRKHWLVFLSEYADFM